MDFITEYPEYTPIEKHIRAAGIERVVGISNMLADFIVACCTALMEPPTPSAVIIERRSRARSNDERAVRFSIQ